MIAMKSVGDESAGRISLELRDGGGMCLRVEHPETRPDGTVEIVLNREQTQLLSLLLTTAEQVSSD